MMGQPGFILACLVAALAAAPRPALSAECDEPSFAAAEFSPLILRPEADPEVVGRPRGITVGRFSKRPGEARSCGCDMAIAVTARGTPAHDYLFLMRGNEDGTFSRAAVVKTAPNPLAIAAGRFTAPQSAELDALAVVTGGSDEPGKLALLVPSERGGEIVYETAATGPWTVGQNTPRAGIVAGKFNRDEHLDVAIAGDNDLTVLFGTAAGGFTLGQTLPMPAGEPVSLAAGDFTAQSDTDDIAIGIDLKVDANTRSGVMVLRWDDASGQMKPATDAPIVLGPLGTGDTIVAAADLSRAGVQRDLVAAYTITGGALLNGTVKLLVGRDEGLFHPVSVAGTLSVAGTPRSVTLTRIDGDAVVDLVVSTHGSADDDSKGTVQLFQGKGGSASEAGFRRVEAWRTIPAERPRSLAAIKLGAEAAAPGAGRIVLATTNDESVSLFVGGGDGVFVEPPLVVTETQPELTLLGQGRFAGAAPGAGPLDLAGALKTPSGKQTLSILLGNGAGSFGPAGEAAESPPTVLLGTKPALMASGKLDSDAITDLAVVDVAPSVTPTKPMMRILKGGDERGAFAELSIAELQSGEAPIGIAAAAFTGQGPEKPLDLAVLSKSKLTIWVNDGAGKFRMGSELALNFLAIKMAVSNKFRGGSRYDVVISAESSFEAGDRSFAFLLNDGAGRFRNGGFFRSDNSVDFLFAEDVNGDNFTDVITFGFRRMRPAGSSFFSLVDNNRVQVFINDKLEGFVAAVAERPFAGGACDKTVAQSVFPLRFGSKLILAGFVTKEMRDPPGFLFSGQRSLIFSLKGDGQGRFPAAICSEPNFPSALGSIVPRFEESTVNRPSVIPRPMTVFNIDHAMAGQFRNRLHGNSLPELAARGVLVTLEVREGRCPPPVNPPPPAPPQPQLTICEVKIDPGDLPDGSTDTVDLVSAGSFCPLGQVATCGSGVRPNGHCPNCFCAPATTTPLPVACQSRKTYPPLILTFANRCGG